MHVNYYTDCLQIQSTVEAWSRQEVLRVQFFYFISASRELFDQGFEAQNDLVLVCNSYCFRLSRLKAVMLPLSL